MRGGVVSRFSVQTFLSHIAEKFRRGESSCVSVVSGIEKNCIRGGEYQDFPWRKICLTVPNIFVGGNHLVFHQIRVSKNFMLRRLMSRLSISCRRFFVPQCRNNS